MGTSYSIKYNTNSVNINYKNLKWEVDSILININNIFSTYIDSSEINRINNSDKDTIYISNHFKEVLNTSIDIYNNTSHYFDPSISPLIKLWNFDSKSEKVKIPDKFEVENTIKKIGLKKIKIKEVSINYHGRSYQEGKKITYGDGFRAIKSLFKYRFFY